MATHFVHIIKSFLYKILLWFCVVVLSSLQLFRFWRILIRGKERKIIKAHDHLQDFFMGKFFVLEKHKLKSFFKTSTKQQHNRKQKSLFHFSDD